MQGVTTGAAADFEHIGIGGELQGARNFVGLFGSGPASLAEVTAVGGDAHLAINISVVVGVGVVVEIDGSGHGEALCTFDG